ncbi:MAG TPA: hypothetical protein VF186_10090 [Gaiellaceae bacterium]|jgi:hypothetical protein
MDSRARRIGENEILFRHVNEQMRSLDEKLGTLEDEYEFLCECGNAACAERIPMTIPEYESIHADPTQFVVLEGHEIPIVEDVVERRPAYTVIRKRPGGPAELAAEDAAR